VFHPLIGISTLGAMDSRFPRRAMAVSLLAIAASTVLAAVLGTLMVTQWYTRSDRATTEVVGRASPISATGSDGWTSYVAEVEVAWTDDQGELHRVRFDVAPGSEWPT
jgi:hypothetical protein